ncbi:MAG TPA: ABC transporter substrate-binding protein, partial [Anaerolineaceae bacterium]|nr:ABC transporter substrate-binding protein [Anaerolineaceae bacterium]
MKPRRLLRCMVLLAWLLLLSACLWRRPVQVGFAGELSGRESDLGIGSRNGVLLAAEQINAAGGIDGHPIEIIVKDDAGKPDVARQVDQELVDAGVVAIIGHSTTSQTIAGLEVTQPAGIVMLSPSASSQSLTGIDDLFFRVCADNTLDVIALANHIYAGGQHTLAIIYDADNDAYARRYAEGVQMEFERLGGKITRIEAISAD